jgi:hypothetical protein
MWRARNPDNPRIVAALNEQSTLRFVPFASSANLMPELKEAMQLEPNERGLRAQSPELVKSCLYVERRDVSLSSQQRSSGECAYQMLGKIDVHLTSTAEIHLNDT